jgi:hypothetical protein
VKAGQARCTRVEYLVQWKGYPNPTWEKQESLRGAPEMVADYYHRAPVGTELMPDELKSLLSSSAASSSTASRQAHTDYEIGAELEDDETFARIAHEMQGVKARWNSPV